MAVASPLPIAPLTVLVCGTVVAGCSIGPAGALLSGTSGMFAAGGAGACVATVGTGAFGCCAAFTSLGSKPWISDPMTKAMISSATNAIAPRTLRFQWRSARGGAAPAVVAACSGFTAGFSACHQLQ